MIQRTIVKLSRRIALSAVLSAAILSIANVDTLWRESQGHEELMIARKEKAREILRHRLERNPSSSEPTQTVESRQDSVVEKLRESFTQDEIGDINPFAGLASVSDLKNILAKGLKSFERQTFRSSKYKSEAGYDVVHYEILHKDGSRSSVLAYLEPDLVTEEQQSVVVFLRGSPSGSDYSLYRGGEMKEQSAMNQNHATDLVAQRLSSAVPFLSVAR